MDKIAHDGIHAMQNASLAVTAAAKKAPLFLAQKEKSAAEPTEGPASTVVVVFHPKYMEANFRASVAALGARAAPTVVNVYA